MCLGNSEELLLLVAGETARLITEVRQEEHKRHQLEAVNQVKLHLERLNAFLDTVTSAAAITESSTYAGAMAKQLKGLVNASKEAGLAKVYFEQAADVFQGIGIEFGGGTEQAGSSLAFSFRESGGGLFRLERVLDLVRGQSGKEICGSDQGDIKRNQAVG
ncbi:MAG: hypothetical protein K0R67_3710 [Paenibacillus sp.]|jgi:hypothetical protein|nr:hypothetical protein [Paenibacillus sp.]